MAKKPASTGKKTPPNKIGVRSHYSIKETLRHDRLMIEGGRASWPGCPSIRVNFGNGEHLTITSGAVASDVEAMPAPVPLAILPNLDGIAFASRSYFLAIHDTSGYERVSKIKYGGEDASASQVHIATAVIGKAVPGLSDDAWTEHKGDQGVIHLADSPEIKPGHALLVRPEHGEFKITDLWLSRVICDVKDDRELFLP